MFFFKRKFLYRKIHLYNTKNRPYNKLKKRQRYQNRNSLIHEREPKIIVSVIITEPKLKNFLERTKIFKYQFKFHKKKWKT